jgi:hypothetical protein
VMVERSMLRLRGTDMMGMSGAVARGNRHQHHFYSGIIQLQYNTAVRAGACRALALSPATHVPVRNAERRTAVRRPNKVPVQYRYASQFDRNTVKHGCVGVGNYVGYLIKCVQMVVFCQELPHTHRVTPNRIIPHHKSHTAARSQIYML